MIFHLIRVLSAGLAISASAGEVESPIPLAKGTKWVYEAEVRWTPVDGGEVRSNHFRFTNEVIECFQQAGTTAAVVRAFPNDIGGMDPEVPQDFCVLVWSSNKLHRLDGGKTLKQSQKLAKKWAESSQSKIKMGEPFLMTPLTLGKRWDEIVPNREDGWYGWQVEAVTNHVPGIKGVPPSPDAKVITVTYRTLPSHELMDVLPGVGITRYEFVHHGTVGEEYVKLVEFVPVGAGRMR